MKIDHYTVSSHLIRPLTPAHFLWRSFSARRGVLATIYVTLAVQFQPVNLLWQIKFVIIHFYFHKFACLERHFVLWASQDNYNRGGHFVRIHDTYAFFFWLCTLPLFSSSICLLSCCEKAFCIASDRSQWKRSCGSLNTWTLDARRLLISFFQCILPSAESSQFVTSSFPDGPIILVCGVLWRSG